MVSEAPTKATIRLWNAMGRASVTRCFRKTLSLKVEERRLFFIRSILDYFISYLKGKCNRKAFVVISGMSRLERIMDMINVLCLEDGRLNYAYIRDKYGMSNREFRRDIEFIRERLTDIGYMDKMSTVEYVRREGGNYYVYNGDKPKLNEAFASSTIAESLREAAYNPLREQFDVAKNTESSNKIKPVRYMFSALEKVDYNIFTTLVAAIKENRTIELDYINAKGIRNPLKMHPMELINYSQLWYLKVETEYGSIRTYNLSRIQKVRMLDSHFFRDEEKLKKSEGSYGIFSSAKDTPIWYTMRFYGVAANIVSNQIWHSEEKSRWNDDGGYELSVPAVSHVEIMGRMLSFAPDAEPVSPPEFVEAYREKVRKMYEKIGDEK